MIRSKYLYVSSTNLNSTRVTIMYYTHAYNYKGYTLDFFFLRCCSTLALGKTNFITSMITSFVTLCGKWQVFTSLSNLLWTSTTFNMEFFFTSMRSFAHIFRKITRVSLSERKNSNSLILFQTQRRLYFCIVSKIHFRKNFLICILYLRCIFVKTVFLYLFEICLSSKSIGKHYDLDKNSLKQTLIDIYDIMNRNMPWKTSTQS